MPKDLVFELGVEEVPAGYLSPAIAQLEQAIRDRLSGARLSFGEITTYATPRRLAAIVENLSEKQEELERVVVGPPARIAFGDDGSPTKAAIGFAKSQSVDVSDLKIVGDYVQVDVLDGGMPAADVVPGCLSAALDGLYFPKTMRWGPAARFARPVRWLVAMLGGDVLDMEYAGVRAGRETRGLRFWSPGPHVLNGASDYVGTLTENFVIPAHRERRGMIANETRRVAKEKCGGRVVVDESLLDEVTFLVECPTVFAGRFAARFLELPRDVIVAAMKGHQRYFAVESPDGSLLPFFLGVANAPGARAEGGEGAPSDHIDVIREGNEHVLESRLDDAAFYWAEDTRTPLASKVESLGNVVWLEGLGSLLDKTVRMEKLCERIAAWFESDEGNVAARAARLSKADLVTEMVKDGKEFTELQGAMGYWYALASGEPEAVASAIRQHYLPRFAGDALPDTNAGLILSIADRMDSIAGCFSIGLVPTGSRDPYALRRQAIGLVRMIDEKSLKLSLRQLAREAASGHGVAGDDAAGLLGGVLDFIRKRAWNYFVEAGFAYDLVDAVLEASLDDLAGVRPRLVALTHFREKDDFAGLVIGARRVTNILRDQPPLPLDPSSLVEPSSRALDSERARVEREVEAGVAEGDFDRAVASLLSLRESIDAFFDDVMVMVDDQELREARLGLLSSVRALFVRIADFAKVVLEGEEPQNRGDEC
jgi:glycyl-tRNA synthetase beta chain